MDGGIHYNLALTYKNRGMTQEAILEYEKAIELDPYMREAYYNLITIYESEGEKNKAKETWGKYLELVSPEEIHKERR